MQTFNNPEVFNTLLADILGSQERSLTLRLVLQAKEVMTQQKYSEMFGDTVNFKNTADMFIRYNDDLANAYSKMAPGSQERQDIVDSLPCFNETDCPRKTSLLKEKFVAYEQASWSTRVKSEQEAQMQRILTQWNNSLIKYGMNPEIYSPVRRTLEEMVYTIIHANLFPVPPSVFTQPVAELNTIWDEAWNNYRKYINVVTNLQLEVADRAA